MIIIGSGQWGEGANEGGAGAKARSHKSTLGTRMDKRFTTNSTWSEGMGCNVCQLIVQLLIMAGKDKTFKRAGKAMVHRGELVVATAITMRKNWGIGHN